MYIIKDVMFFVSSLHIGKTIDEKVILMLTLYVPPSIWNEIKRTHIIIPDVIFEG